MRMGATRLSKKEKIANLVSFIEDGERILEENLSLRPEDRARREKEISDARLRLIQLQRHPYYQERMF